MIHWKILACLFVCMFLLQPSSGMATFFQQYLTDAPLVIQRDERYQTDLYDYNKARFQERGCGPASVANALTIACGIQEQTLSDHVMRDIMRLISTNHIPSESIIDSQYIYRMQDFDPQLYTGLGYIRSQYGEFWHADRDGSGETEILSYFQSAREAGARAFFATTFATRGAWNQLIQLAEHLEKAGFGDTIITVCLLSSGTEGTIAPFRLGTGHYETICMHAGEFVQSSTVYLIDSCPRALPWEEKVKRVYYDTYFLTYDGVSLTETFDIRRVLPTILRLRLREDTGLEKSEAMERLLFYGTGCLILTLPQVQRGA